MKRVAVTEYSHIIYPPFTGIDTRRYLKPHEGNYHSHSYHQIIAVLSGGIVFMNANGTEYQCHCGDVLTIPAQVSHSWRISEPRCETVQIYHDSLRVDQYGEIAVFFGQSNQEMLLYTLSPDEFSSLMRGIKNEVTAKKYKGGLLLHARLIELMALIGRQSPIEIQPSSRTLGLVRETLRFIECHLRDPLTLERLADNVHLSASRLSHIFKEYTGKSPLRYINDLRLERAQNMMVYSAMNISQIAEYYGFSSIHYFSRLFKKKCGLSPTAFLSRLNK